jgi:opacity protein-like surface antigen
MTLRSAVMLLSLALLLLQAPPAAADASADWQAGQDAFAAGDVASALVFFTSARDQGMAGPAVHYNIAVCQYELGDYAAARDTFAMIAERFPKMRGLAEYNVGLAERRLGNLAAAQSHFIAAWYASEDPKVRALAAGQLNDVERETPVATFGMVSFSGGYDDNVALRDSLGLPAGTSGESPFADLYAMLNIPMAAVEGLSFDGAVYAISYPDADEFNQAEVRAGLLYERDAGDWQLRAGLHIVTGTLDGSRFNEELNADFRATWYAAENSSLELRLRYDEIRGTEALFEGIDGSRTRFDVRYRWNRLPHYLVVRASFEDNDRRDVSISPNRQRLQANYYYQLDDRWEIEAGAAYRVSDYDNAVVLRDENLAAAAIGANYEINDDWALGLHYRYSDNDSSDPTFSYERNQFTVGVRYLFEP